MPAVIERARLRDSQVLYAWVRKQGWPMAWAQDIEATLENLASRPELQQGPMVAAGRGLMGGKGTVWFTVTLTPGRYSARMTFRCEAGRLIGSIDPHLEETELRSSGDPGSGLKVFFGKIELALSGPTEGTRPSGAIAVRDDLTDPKLQLAPRLEKVIENGFSLGLQEALKRHYAGKTEASEKREGTPLKARD